MFPSHDRLGGPTPVVSTDRVELLGVIRRFEEAVAAAGVPGWRARLIAEMDSLRDAVAAHIRVTEGPDGLYAELQDTAPRLAGPVARLVREHATIAAELDSLTPHLTAWEPPAVAPGTQRLRTHLATHRRRGADLLYEAYSYDLGGET